MKNLEQENVALKARVEELERGKDAMLWADLTVKLREATQERDSLRAQLEAAQLRGTVLEEELNVASDLTAKLTAQLEAAKEGERFNGERVAMLEATVSNLTRTQLTAQPEGVGALLQAWVDWYAQGSGPQFKTPPYSQSIQALAAAPSGQPEGVRGLARRLIRACRQHDIGGVGTVEEYLNAQHALAIELAKTESLAAPAQADGEGKVREVALDKLVAEAGIVFGMLVHAFDSGDSRKNEMRRLHKKFKEGSSLTHEEVEKLTEAALAAEEGKP